MGLALWLLKRRSIGLVGRRPRVDPEMELPATHLLSITDPGYRPLTELEPINARYACAAPAFNQDFSYAA